MRKSKIFVPSNEIPPIHVHRRQSKPSAPEGQLKNHHNKGSHTGHMDDVNRSSHPEADELPSKFMGNEDGH